jgi:membrane associated rhomboid family serine protease
MFPIKDTIPSRTFPIVNWLIIATNIAVFVLVELPLSPGALERLVMEYGAVPAQCAAPVLSGAGLASRLLLGGCVVPLFTSMFLHGGWLHIISNLWALFIFGDNIEDRMGSGRYLVFYLVCGLVAGLAQVAIDPTSTVPAIGASGAIAGVLGAYLILFPNSRVITLIPLFFLPWFVELPAILYLGIWFATQFFSGLSMVGVEAGGGVAYWAHIGGFISGLVLVWLFAPPARRRRPQYRWYPDEYRPW